jgi:hypothetical protein
MGKARVKFYRIKIVPRRWKEEEASVEATSPDPGPSFEQYATLGRIVKPVWSVRRGAVFR